MGLDIYHFKVSLNPETEYDYLEVEFFPKEAFEKYGFDEYITESPLLGEDEKCVSHTKVGYQRKGMLLEFYKEFTNDTVYLERYDFERLSRYVDDSFSTADRSNIQENFIDSYENGKSFLYISW
ncbi:MAG: hypothetical protein AAF542_05435 [Pseudomonadota bacterium]